MIKPKTAHHGLIVLLLLLANLATCLKVKADFPKHVAEELKKYENWSLATADDNKVVTRAADKYGNVDIAYGVTPTEVEDAKRLGILPKDAVFPNTMNKKEADLWHDRVTIPTYRAIVRSMVKVPLTPAQEAGLTLFVQNTGRSNLKKLITGKNRLNEGNYDSVIRIMPLYYKDPDLKTRCDFQVAVYSGKQFTPKT